MIPVLVEPVDGGFRASLSDSSSLRAEGATKDEAVAALQTALAARMASGELVWLNLPTRPVTDFAGVFKDDPYLQGIVDEAYRLRDEQKAAEFPE